MATILNIYVREPNFLPTAEDPDAARYKYGSYWLHAVGGEPTPGEVTSMLNTRGQPIDPRIAPGPNADLESVKEFLRHRVRS